MWTLSASGLGLILSLTTINAQFFHPLMDDRTYLDSIEGQVGAEVREAQLDLLEETKFLANLTEAYIGAKLKENIYSALTTMSEAAGQNLSTGSKNPGSGGDPSKLVRQLFEGEGDTEGLDFAVKVTGVVFKSLLLIPNFFRELFKQQQNGANSTLKGVTTPNPKIKAERQLLMETSLSTQAEPFLLDSPSSEAQFVGLVNLLSGQKSQKKAALQNDEQKNDQVALKFINNLRQMMLDRDGHSRDIFSGVHEAYNLVDELRPFISQLEFNY